MLDRELRYLRVNQTLAEFNGVPVETHLGRKAREVLPNLPDFVERHLERVFATGEPLVSIRREAVRVGAVVAGALAPRQLLPAARRRQRDLRHRRGARGRERAAPRRGRDRAASGCRSSWSASSRTISRNPLNAITLTTEGLLRKSDLSAPVNVALARLSKSARRMAALIAQLLDFTRVRSSGGMPIEKRPTDLTEICRGVIEEIRAAHPSRSFELATSEDTSGVWDPDRLAQVVSNLVSSAVCYGHTDSPIVVTVADEGSRVSCAIHNEGDPIPAEKIAHLFDPFHRAECGPAAIRRARARTLHHGPDRSRTPRAAHREERRGAQDDLLGDAAAGATGSSGYLSQGLAESALRGARRRRAP